MACNIVASRLYRLKQRQNEIRAEALYLFACDVWPFGPILLAAGCISGGMIVEGPPAAGARLPSIRRRNPGAGYVVSAAMPFRLPPDMRGAGHEG